MSTLVAPAPPPAYRTTTKERSRYSEVLQLVKKENLLKKNPRFYMVLLGVVSVVATVVWGGLITTGVLMQGSWWELFWAVPLAAVLGVVTAQYGFVAHEAAHKQVFASHRANEWLGLILANLFAGMSYGFWLNKHNRHHQKPNQIGADPDIELPILSFYPESLAAKKGIERIASRNQGWLFPFLLMFTAFHFIWDSAQSLAKPRRYVKHRWLEAALMVIRTAFPITMFMVFFGPLQGGILYLVFMFSFGLFIGGAFAPNHKGMPVVPRDSKLSFFDRQVLLSRNVSPSPLKDLLMGGLNYQVEHHLFPSMPRTSLNRAHQLVKDYCQRNAVPFTEVGLVESYRRVITYLNEVGLGKGNTDPFVCPQIAELRPRM